MYIEIAAEKFYDYSLNIKGYSRHTVRRYRGTINLFCSDSRVEKFEQVTDAVVRQFFYDGRIERQWKTSTFNTLHKSLLVFFRWCVKQGYMAANFVEDIELPKAEKLLPPKLTRQDALRLLEVAYNYPYACKFLRYRNHALFSVFLFAGLRKSELLNLKSTDVDTENLSIFVRQGKGAKDRVVPMSFTLAQSLKRYMAERARLKRHCPEFFVSSNRDQGFTENGLQHLVEQMTRASGIRFSVHKLRHSFATLMLEGGCDIYSLSRMMGHSDIKTTTIYLAASVEHLRAQIGKHPLN